MKTRNDKTAKRSAAGEGRQGLAVGRILDCRVSGLNPDGLGMGVTEEGPLLVRGALPDELVRARVTYAGRGESCADLVKVLRRSPQRLVNPFCARGIACDACPLAEMRYEAQLEWKRGLVEGFIHGYPSLRRAVVHPVEPSAKPVGYRNSAKLVVAGKFASPLIGIYRGHSHEVIDIGDCPLHHPLINRVVLAVKEGIRKGRVPIYSPRSGSGILRYLVVRVSETEGKAMVVFVTARRSFNEIHHLAKQLRSQVAEVSVVAQNVNPSAGNVIMGQSDHFVTREQALMDAIGGIRFSISPRSFFQVNAGGAETIYGRVRTWAGLSGRERVVDVYCGVGGISLSLAAAAGEVIGLETVEDAVADAEKNARLNGIRNCSFRAGDAADLLDDLREGGGGADLVVLNPPRKGCDVKVLRGVAALGPGKVIYVSCSPKTLARDLDILSGLGFRTVEVRPVDMFPQTPHVESVALLIKEG